MTLATVPRYERSRSAEWGERAVVVGAGMAGLFAARVLADGFEEVTVVEKDPLPDDPVARRGVPQSRHVHVLLRAGQVTLEDLFPGWGEDVLAAGGLVIDASRDVRFFAEGGFLADGPERIPLYCATRPLYERLVRRRVAALDGVDLRPECQFVESVLDESGTAVEGVRVRNEGSSPETVEADLVVDATGRTSRTPAWLEDHGYEPPPLDEVHIDLAYSTAAVERPPDDRRAYVVTPSPPGTRGGSVHTVEGGRWLVTLVGLHGDRPPTDLDGFHAFAAGLPTPAVKRILDEHALAADAIDHYAFPSNRRYRYEDLDRFPEGLVVVGDAVASFNPIYGQGLSVAALEAVQLHRALASGGLDGLASRFFERAAATVDAAWNVTVGTDHQFPETVGPRPRGAAVMNGYLSRLLRGAQADGVLADAFTRVIMMERPPSSLLRPAIAWRVLR